VPSHQPHEAKRPPGFRLNLCPADIGRRVTIRSVRPEDGSAFDTVGPLVVINDHQLAIEGKHGLTTVNRQSVVAGRVVPPGICAVDLQRIAQDVWPPLESELLGEWNLRWAGAGERSDSVRVGGDPGIALADAIAYASDWYTERGSHALFQVPSPWLASELRDLGCQPVRRVVMMTASTG